MDSPRSAASINVGSHCRCPRWDRVVLFELDETRAERGLEREKLGGSRGAQRKKVIAYQCVVCYYELLANATEMKTQCFMTHGGS